MGYLTVHLQDNSSFQNDTNALDTNGDGIPDSSSVQDNSSFQNDTNVVTPSASGPPAFQNLSTTSAPIVQMTGFNPSTHGFHFANNFINKIIDKTVFGHHFDFQTEGRCGGMAFASLDYYFNHMPIPSYTTNDFQSSNGVPPDGHPIANYIWKRLLDSYTFTNVKNFVSWTERPDRTESVSDTLYTNLVGRTGWNNCRTLYHNRWCH